VRKYNRHYRKERREYIVGCGGAPITEPMKDYGAGCVPHTSLAHQD
jgi:methanogenic corrinoid protein MtbC1